MKAVLQDIIKQTSSLYDGIEFTNDGVSTTADGINKQTITLVNIKLKEPIPEFVGIFGINDLNKLNGLLNFPAYNTAESKITMVPGKFKDQEMIQKMRFEDGRGGFTELFMVMPGGMGKGQVGNPNYGLRLSPDKNRLAEFRSLAAIHGNATAFTPVVENNRLYFSIDKSARVLIAEDIMSSFSTSANWTFSSFDKIVKVVGDRDYELAFSQGLLKITVETEFAIYEHILRGNKA